MALTHPADIRLNRYQPGPAPALEWRPEFAAAFPGADHHMCTRDACGACVDWHCTRCGAPANVFGGHLWGHADCHTGRG
jgi:hypothetical protein